MKRLLLLFPSDFFEPKKIDPDMKKEYEAAIETGLFEIVIFDYEKWFHKGILSVNVCVEEPTKAVYRGWMMKPMQYQNFYEKLKLKNIELITQPASYGLMHMIPNVYESFGEDTSKMIVFPEGEQIDLLRIKDSFERFMIKDYVKSVKGTDFPKCFTNDVNEAEFEKWMGKFYEYRGELFTGGICAKEYLSLKTINGHTNEYR